MFDGLPPQVSQAFITLFVALLLGVVSLIGGVVLYFRSSMKNSASKQAIEIATFKTSYDFVLEQAKRLTERADKQDETIAVLREGKASDSTKIQMLSDQLQEARLHSRERDERLGELKAKLEQAIEERATQAKRAAEMADRITELEDRQKERHEINTKLELRLKEIDVAKLEAEKERDAALKALKAANERIIQLETEIATLRAEAEKVAAVLTPPAVEPTMLAPEGGVA